MKVEHFRDLDCWKKARELVCLIYQHTRHTDFSRDFGLRDQIQRASVSVTANIAEGFGSKTDVEFIRFLSISIRSIYEVQSHLYIALDVGHIDQEEFSVIEVLTNDCINLCKGLIRYLKSKT